MGGDGTDEFARFWTGSNYPSTRSSVPGTASATVALATFEDSAAGTAAPPSHLRRIEDEGEIARGGMSTVRRVRDVAMRRRAAMKVLNMELRNPRAHIHFLREAQILAQLDHPNIPPVYDIGMTDAGEPCFTMKLVKGQTLGEILAGKPARAARELESMLAILLKVCDAISFAHSRGVVHRDIKPDNIMVGTHGQVYLMDWGCARVLGDAALAAVAGADLDDRVLCDEIAELDRPGFVIGTGAYMAPEQALGCTDEVGPTADVFALGSTLYQVLTGRPPHHGKTLASCLASAQSADVKPLLELDPGLPPGLCAIIGRALAAAPAARYPTVDELARDLKSFLTNGALLATQWFAAGAVIVDEGEPASNAFIVVEGRCVVCRRDGDRQVPLRELGPGEVFGETGIITRKPRSASVAALTDVTVTVVPPEALTDALSLGSWIGLFVRALAERFREADTLVASLRESLR